MGQDLLDLPAHLDTTSIKLDDAHGNVTGPEHYGCNILDDSIKKIVNTFKAMWVYSLQHCLVYGSQRYW